MGEVWRVSQEMRGREGGCPLHIDDVVASSAGIDVQAPGVALEPTHTPKPLESRDAKASSSGATTPKLENYLSFDGRERVLLEECVEMRGADFPQSRGDDAQLHRNLIMASMTCGYKGPDKPCGYRIAPSFWERQEAET